MKAGIFALTKNEQRVVILILVALLAAAFVRYWHNVKSFPPNRPGENNGNARPDTSLEEEGQPGSEESSEKQPNKSPRVPSPRSSP